MYLGASLALEEQYWLRPLHQTEVRSLQVDDDLLAFLRRLARPNYAGRKCRRMRTQSLINARLLASFSSRLLRRTDHGAQMN